MTDTPPLTENAPEQARDHDRPEDTAHLRSVVVFSLLTGLCCLIPIPFLDDWAVKLFRRRAVLHQCRTQDVHLTDEEVDYLAHGDPSFQAGGCLKGCFLGALMKTVLYGIRKIFSKMFRTVLFFLTVRDVLNTFSHAFHEGYVLQHALALGVLPRGTASPYPSPLKDLLRSSVVSLRFAIETAYTALDHSPLSKIMRTTLAGSRGLLRHFGRTIARLLRPLRRRKASEDVIEETIRQQSEEELGGLIDSLTREISRETDYLRRMEETLEEALGLSASTELSSET